MRDRLTTEEFVGRRSELRTFEEAISHAKQGLPSVLLVSGDAGIGKTTIVSESASRAGLALYLGRSTHIGGDAIPLAPLADLLRQLRRTRADLLADTPGLEALRRWSMPGGYESDTSAAGGLFVAMLELITLLTIDDAVVVGFEDLHWADAVTWDLFEYLARNLIDERVVLVGTYRHHEVSADPSQRQRLAELSRLPATERIHLDGLERDDVAARIAALTGKPAPTALVDQVVARGQGNPFFTRELVAAHLAGETIPMVLSDLISVEIAGLDDDAQAVLAAVAAIGRETTHELLAAIVDLPAGADETAVRTAVDAQLLVVDADRYRFRHPLLGEVIYSDLLPPQRMRLHGRIADVLRQQSVESLRRPDRAGELAFHLDRSGDNPSAFVALLAAADAAQEVAPAAAFAQLERALELWDSVGDVAARESRGDRLWQAADLAASVVGNQRAVELARDAFVCGPPPLGAAFGHERLGRYLWSTGQLDQSRVEFERAADLLPAEDRAEVAPVLAGLGQAALMAGEYADAERWCARVFDLVPAPDGNIAAWVMARRVLGISRSTQGEPEQAVDLCREAVAFAASVQERALAGLYLCVALIDAGDFQGTVDVASDAAAEGQLTGLDQGFGGYFDGLAAEALIRLGRWQEADNVLARHPLTTTLPVGRLRIARAAAMLAARRGETGNAIAHLADLDAQPVDGWHQTVRDEAIADVHLALGNWADAARAAEHGWQSTHTTSVLFAARFAMLSTEAAVEQTLDDIARRDSVDPAATTAQLQQRLDELADQAAAIRHRATSANLAQTTATLTRLTTPGTETWGIAVARWTDLQDRWATARATLREAEAHALHGHADRATSALQHAHAVASELAAAPLLTEIEALALRTRISLEPPTRIILEASSTHTLGLTAREAEVLALVAAGRTNRQIGEQLFVSDKTASVHVSNILRKLGVNTRVDAAAIAQRLGIT